MSCESLQEDLQVGSSSHLDLDFVTKTCSEAESIASLRGLAGGKPMDQDPSLSLPLLLS